MHVPQERYDAIAREIASDDSPVGIDAKKTHIVIIHLLEDLQRRLDRIEAHLGLTNDAER
ncbi:MAG: hypothetical protein GVY18_02645 [Bacteroidetes bacterium]|jgi:hypothetical protein|nr:hypothetical protein [Bacteroidota bacterium]